MEKLITRYLQNKLTDEEAKELKDWLERDPINRTIFENIVSHWRISNQEVEEVKARVRRKVTKTSGDFEKKGRRNTYLRIAALLIAGLSLSFIIHTLNVFSDNNFIQKTAARGEKLVFELPDGSTVTLNSGSTVKYREKFSSTHRNITLNGEAYFDVARDPNRPFSVMTGKLQAKVLGTSFNVRSYAEESNATVAVKNGKVAVCSEVSSDSLILHAEDIAVYQGESQRIKKEHIAHSESVFGWTERTLSFEDLTFNEITTLVSRWYDVDFVEETRVDRKKLFTATYKDPSLKTVLESLSYAFGFNYKIEEKLISIY